MPVIPILTQAVKGVFKSLNVAGDIISTGKISSPRFTDPTSNQRINAGGELANGYAQITANQAAIVGVVDVTGLTVTVNVNPGRRIKITACANAQNTNADQGCQFFIKEGSTSLENGITLNGNAGVSSSTMFAAVLSPSAGSHTYKVTAQNYVGGTVTVTATTSNPAWILVEDIGVL